jgi:hypothetical protein
MHGATRARAAGRRLAGAPLAAVDGVCPGWHCQGGLARPSCLMELSALNISLYSSTVVLVCRVFYTESHVLGT